MYRPAVTLPYDTSSRNDELRHLDLYVPEQPSDKLVVFVHGGAWGAGDKSEHTNIPLLLASVSAIPSLTSALSSRLPIVAIPNYRLCKRPPYPERDAVHPTHILDVARSLAFLTAATQGDATALTDDKDIGIGSGQENSAIGSLSHVEEIYLVGHSCGTHILSFIAYDHPVLRSNLTTQEYASLQHTMNKVKGYAWLEGIYDLLELVEEYPEYLGWFVDGAFPGGKVALEEGSITRSVLTPASSFLGLKNVVAHSRDDELLTFRQSRLWEAFLRKAGGERVTWDEVTLKGTHDGCLIDEGLGRLILGLISDEE